MAIEFPYYLREESSLNDIEFLVESLDNYRQINELWKSLIKDEDVNNLRKSNDILNFFEELLNILYSRAPSILNPDILRTEWKKFNNSGKKILYFQSSATTSDLSSISAWTEKDIESVVRFLAYHLSKLYDVKPTSALLLLPYGVSQDINVRLMWELGAESVYFIGLETMKLKVLPQEEIVKRVEPAFKRAKQYLEVDKEIDTIRTGPFNLEVFSPYSDRIKFMILSGAGISVEFLNNYLKRVFPNTTFIVDYADSLFGDAIGVIEGNKIIYYPPPNVYMFPVRIEDKKIKIVNVGEEGYRALIRFGDAALYVFVDLKEKITRENPAYGFKSFGFSNPRREVKPS